MSRFRTFTLLAALTASSAAYADKPAEPPATKPAEPPAAKAADKPATKPSDKASEKPVTKAGDKPVSKAAIDKKPTVSAADAKRFYAFFDRLVKIVVVFTHECDKMAAGLNEHIGSNQALLKEAAQAKAAGKELPQAIRDKIAKQSAQELLPAMKQKCATDKAVTEAFMRLKPPDAK